MIPKKELEEFFPLIRYIAKSVEIESLEELETSLLEPVPPDSQTKVRLTYDKGFLDFNFFVKPFGNEGPSFSPGEGNQLPVLGKGNKGLKTERDFSKELANLNRLVNLCQDGIDESLPELDLFTWSFPIDKEIGLDLLTYLKYLENQEKTSIYWSEESKKIEALDLSPKVNLRVSQDKEKKDWFHLSGDVEIDEKAIISLQELLKKVKESESRYIKMSEKKFISLSNSLFTRLKVLEKLGRIGDGESVGLSSLYALNEIVDDPSIDLFCEEKWNRKITSFKTVKDKKYRVPKNFRTKLRPYQKQGFDWLSRMAHLGFGACLADDMGLGKTVQCLALLNHRKSKGPALVIAPASLLINWQRESNTFAPDLNSVILNSKNSGEVLERTDFDLMITSYGQIIRLKEKLLSKVFGTLILDESQTIKNPLTQRAKVCFQLQANFRIALSGTPVENHLLELWSLFHFLNPGLLGNMKSFKDSFIGRNPDNRSLKTIISPFLLRRTKANVLKDLPEKIEKTLFIQQSEEELNFYEALKRNQIEEIKECKIPAERMMKTLVALTKLRRAACHPSLVQKNHHLISSKHNALLDLLHEILQNGHRALIFSQFVDHLKLVGKLLDENQITYQYLDGSVSIKQRQERVDRFQEGEGDTFLISLKAGGFGLNLTAADYVIHLDPWWNPAVEDQASDRSHRIGQKRVVHIYRLVTEHTIEEKILKLHREKRHLAESILSGGEDALKLSASELWNILTAESQN